MTAKGDSDISLWREVWEKKGHAVKENFELEDLLAIDGYDTPASNVTTENWMAYIHAIEKKLKISRGHNVCEIGCGAGAAIFPLYNQGVNIRGVDYAESLIQICRRVMPYGAFEVAEAHTTPFTANMFDIVLSSGVFIYFPNLEYAELVIQEIVRLVKPHGRAAILDLNDVAQKNKCEFIKRQKLGDVQYERLYKNHRHQFYDRTWFEQIAHRYHLHCEIEDQILAGYANAEFRFNVFFQKTGP
jgi:ubiquinone/menaquinone biosynthesis C-methylase UbiE